jgi:hypothetical protein
VQFGETRYPDADGDDDRQRPYDNCASNAGPA